MKEIVKRQFLHTDQKDLIARSYKNLNAFSPMNKQTLIYNLTVKRDLQNLCKGGFGWVSSHLQGLSIQHVIPTLCSVIRCCEENLNRRF